MKKTIKFLLQVFVIACLMMSGAGVVSAQTEGNTYLTGITVVGSNGVTYNVSPSFDKTVTNYYVTVPVNVYSVRVQATPEDSTSTVSVSGRIINYGVYPYTITVQATDGSTRVYKLYVNRVDRDTSATAEDSRLKSLSIAEEGLELSPAFSSDVYQYSLVVPWDVDQVTVDAVANVSGATVEITGADNIPQGSSDIVITVTAQDTEYISRYIITVYREEAAVPEGYISEYEAQWRIYQAQLEYNAQVEELRQQLEEYGVIGASGRLLTWKICTFALAAVVIVLVILLFVKKSRKGPIDRDERKGAE